MEAFFRNDQEVQEWIDLFIEKIFTVSLLSGTDADSEFYQGRQAVEKIALFIQEMLELPEETVMDGIRQLVEQRLPDSRVIENFPNFHQLMNEMILSGLPNTLSVPAMQTTSRANLSLNQTDLSSSKEVVPPVPSSKIVLNGAWSPISRTQDVTIPASICQHLGNSLNAREQNPQVLDSHDLDLQTGSLADHETMNETTNNTIKESNVSDPIMISETDIILKQGSEPPPRRDPFRLNPRKTNPEKVSTLAPAPQFSGNTKALEERASVRTSRVVRSMQIPKNAERLAQVFKQVFPNAVIRWNPTIGKNSFYAQVDKILVYIQETSSIEEIEYTQHLKIEMKKQGWCVYICQKENLFFPRRLERDLRMIIR